MSVFDKAKTISALEAAERYTSATITRKGRKSWCACPLHTEATPSCTFNENGTFYCFGCHAGGTSIDFVMRLLDLSALEAARKICADFGLSEDEPTASDRQRIDHQKKIRQAREATKKASSFVYAVHCALVRWADDRLSELDPADESEATEAQTEALLDYKAKSNNIIDAIQQLENERKEGNLYALLKSIFSEAKENYDMLQTWDETQGTSYARGIRL